MRPALDALYAAFNRAESALDPIQIVRRYEALADRELVGFVAAGLAFGRVASVMASIEGVCAVLGSSPAAFIRTFDPALHAEGLLRLGHRWIRGRDLVGLLWILRQLLDRYGSLERSIAAHAGDTKIESTDALASALNAWVREVREVDLRPAYGPSVPVTPGAWYFFTSPASGSACKRLNLFLRWMVRNDDVDPGGWTSISPAALVVPLDTHTMRLGRCLRLTRRVSPGWKMAIDITRGLREFDAADPVRYDFALCHLGMMGGCGWGTDKGNGACPLRDACKPAKPKATRLVLRGGRRRAD